MTDDKSNKIQLAVESHIANNMITRAHSFPRRILPNSAAPFAKFRGRPF